MDYEEKMLASSVAVTEDDVGGDEPRVGYVQPCGCVYWPSYWAGTTFYMAYTQSYDCVGPHGIWGQKDEEEEED